MQEFLHIHKAIRLQKYRYSISLFRATISLLRIFIKAFISEVYHSSRTSLNGTNILLFRPTFLMSLAGANHSFIPAILSDTISRSKSNVYPGHSFGCHQPQLIKRLSRPSFRMPLAVANQLFIPAILSDAISRS